MGRHESLERRPLLLTIDDAHWLDRPTLSFLLYLAQRVEDLPVALIVALRRSEPGAPEDLLLPLVTHPGAEALQLQPLSDGAAAEVVRSRLPGAEPAFCAACAEVSGGNPFLLSELVLTLEAEGVEPVATSAARVGRVAPDSVLRSTLGRLARVPGPAAALARAVAVLGDDAQLRHAARLAGIDLDESASAADALAAAEILRPDEPLAFVHPLIRALTPTYREASAGSPIFTPLDSWARRAHRPSGWQLISSTLPRQAISGSPSDCARPLVMPPPMVPRPPPLCSSSVRSKSRQLGTPEPTCSSSSAWPRRRAVTRAPRTGSSERSS